MTLLEPWLPFPWEYDAADDSGPLCDDCGLVINATAPGTVWTLKGEITKALHSPCIPEPRHA